MADTGIWFAAHWGALPPKRHRVSGMRQLQPFATALGVVCLLAVPATPAAPLPAAWLAAAARGADEPRVIEIVASRFSFEPSEIQVTVGERVRLVLRTADGLHGIELKKFKIAKEIPRGTKPVTIEFTPGEAGRFPFFCSEYCGDGHDDMKGTLVVLAKDAAPPAQAPPDQPPPQN
jgi:cytochrome c oxidase subunit 2